MNLTLAIATAIVAFTNGTVAAPGANPPGTTDIGIVDVDPTNNDTTALGTIEVGPNANVTDNWHEWECQHKNTGGTDKDLHNAVDDFDKLFGKRRLTAGPEMCFISICRGYYFKFCNRAHFTTKMENIGQRWKAKHTPLPHGRDSNCNTNPGDYFNDEDQKYVFGREEDLWPCERNDDCKWNQDVRKCKKH